MWTGRRHEDFSHRLSNLSDDFPTFMILNTNHCFWLSTYNSGMTSHQNPGLVIQMPNLISLLDAHVQIISKIKFLILGNLAFLKQLFIFSSNVFPHPLLHFTKRIPNHPVAQDKTSGAALDPFVFQPSSLIHQKSCLLTLSPKIIPNLSISFYLDFHHYLILVSVSSLSFACSPGHLSSPSIHDFLKTQIRGF